MCSWCGPCQMIAPIFKELSNTHDDVVFLKVDVDENPGTAAQYSVSAMPTFVSECYQRRVKLHNICAGGTAISSLL